MILKPPRSKQRASAHLAAALGALIGLLAAAQAQAPTQAQTPSEAQGDEQTTCENGACTVIYQAGFFDQYAPVTALDMVRNLPGFALDDGSDARGFGGAAGNLLINGERVSAKSETPSSLLSRIPAADVARIELIRGQIGGLDLRGQSVVANVIRKDTGGSGAWTAGLATQTPLEVFLPFGDATFSGAQGPLRFTASVNVERFQRIRENVEDVTDGADELIEARDELFNETGYLVGGAFNATLSTEKIRYALNAAFDRFDETGGETSIRSPVGSEPFTLFQGDTDRENALEIGGDIERGFGEHWKAKLIGLYSRADFRETGSLVSGPVGEPGVTETQTTFDTLNQEIIARLELDYAGLEGHLFELAVEGAINSLDSDFALLEIEDGVLAVQEVPGAATTVEEERLDLALSDSFRLGPIAVDALLGAEASTITQTGGFAEERSFFFWKPTLTLTYAPNDKTQYRLRALREIGQLDFFDFVSSADLGDDELALGNPELAPDTTVTVDFTVEKRFGAIGVISLTAFHDRVSDVIDLVPLGGILEAPGNIGGAVRTGISGETTLPLDLIGLKNGRVDADGFWRTTRVTDPLTGEDRRLSSTRHWEVTTTIRQDLTKAKFAWNLVFFALGPVTRFGLDELDSDSVRFDFDGFIESRAIDGLRIRLGFEDLLRKEPDRDRLVFAGARSVAPLSFREFRTRRRGRTLFLEVRGTF